MKLEQYNEKIIKEYEKIEKYIYESLATGRVINYGPSSIEGLPSLAVLDIAIIIESINDLPLVNDSLLLSNYIFVGASSLGGEFNYKNNNLDFYPHNLVVIILGSKRYNNLENFKKLLIVDESVFREYKEFLEKTLVGNVSYNYYYQINNYFLVNKLNEFNLYDSPYSIVLPDFNNSIFNITQSLMKHYEVETSDQAKCIPEIDQMLANKNHVIFIIIDGMGTEIIKNHLTSASYLPKHIKKTITSIFPPTTVAATTAIQTGKLPGESGWIAWQQYFEEIDKNVVMFRDEDYYSEKAIEGFSVRNKLKVEDIFTKFKNTNHFSLWPSFREGGFSNFATMIDETIKITKSKENTFTYMYWDELDYYLHEFGLNAGKINEVIRNIDQEIQRLASNVDSNTTIIVSADHGLIDIKPIYINRFKDITSLFRSKPALEDRAVAFYIKDKERFKDLFNRYFGSYFALYEKEDFIAKGFLGEITEENKAFIGDFMAIAIDEYAIISRNQEESFKAAHAGLTADEMLVPLIIIEKTNNT